MRGRTITGDPRRTGPERHRPDPAHEKEVREREPRAAERDRPLTFRERSERALADVGIYCLVPFGELAEAHFGGRHRAARRAVNTWIREGLAREFAGQDAGGTPYALVSATANGASVLRDLAAGQGIDPGQRFTYTLKIRREQVAHASAVYGAARRERERLARDGARLRRIRLERELRGTVSGRSEAARHRLGQRAADAARHRAAAELDLPVDP